MTPWESSSAWGSSARHVLWSEESVEQTRREETSHRAKCAASEAERLLPAIVRPWGLRVGTSGSQYVALRSALRRLGLDREPRHASALASEASLRSALVSWLETHGSLRPGEMGPALNSTLRDGEATWIEALRAMSSDDHGGDDRSLAAAAGRFDVRIVILSTASSEPLVYDLGPGERDEIVLGHFHSGYAALVDAPLAASVDASAKDIYARFVSERAVAQSRQLAAPRKPPVIERVKLVPDEERHCSGAIQPDFYVSADTARGIANVTGPDMGTYVGRFEDRIPDVQYLTTPEACYKYGCYVLPGKAAHGDDAPPA